jgi:8-oxo-dGTP pyrophosphatase MutT (NUDIX family)
MTLFVTASVCVLRDGALLTVRKRGTSMFMLPGGKLEPGETPVECAVREAEEEIGLLLSAGDLVELGDWTSPAANEPDALVRSTVFLTPDGQPVPRPLGEIEELRWQPLEADGHDVAPLLLEHVLPVLRVER